MKTTMDSTTRDAITRLVPGDHIAYRFETQQMLGKGSFGQVCKCFDHKTKTFCRSKNHPKPEKISQTGQGRDQGPSKIEDPGPRSPPATRSKC